MKLILILAFSIISTAAIAINMYNSGAIEAGGLGPVATTPNPPPVCSNVLDFSQACNSQYVGAF